METFIAIWASLSPGMIGASVGLIIDAKSPRGFMGRSQIAISTGGLAGYLAMAFLSYQGLRTGINPYTPLVANSISILAAILVLVALRAVRPFKLNQRFTVGVSMTGAAILLFIGAAIYQHLLLPIQGWDVIDFWGRYAHWTLMEPDSLPQSTKPHPVTIVLVQAWSAWCAQAIGAPYMMLVPWLFMTIILGTGLYGYSLWASQSRFFSLLLLYCFLTLPLLENHTLIAGYAELFLTATCVTSVIWLQLSLSKNSMVYAAIGLSTAPLALFIKNTGLFYCAVLIFPYITILLYSRSRVLFLSLATAVVAAIFYFSISGFSIDYFGLGLSLYTDGGTWVLHAAGWGMPVVYNGLIDVIRNEIYSLFFNMSFGITALLGIFIFLFLRKISELKFIFFIIFIILLMLMASQFFFDYGFKHAVPTHDTGNSRLSLPLIAVLFLLIPHAFFVVVGGGGTGRPMRIVSKRPKV